LVSNGTLIRRTLENLASRVLGVKYDLGLFEKPLIPNDVGSNAITEANVPLTLEAAEKSILLLENRDSILPLHPTRQNNISQIALIGPFSDSFNYGDYSGQCGGYPVKNASTIRPEYRGAPLYRFSGDQTCLCMRCKLLELQRTIQRAAVPTLCKR
jgi:beta-glucosidase-like glycosyl hydrolase